MTDRQALEDQRDFLLRSLEDLERERAAGDVDERDYRALKDDYTVRAARVLRTLDAGTASSGSTHRGLRRRTLVAGAAVILFAVVAGLLVAQASGRRDPGDTATGDIRQSVTEKLNEAGRRSGEGDVEGAIGLYDEVLEADPDNVEAMTYRGWVLVLSGDTTEGLPALLEAATTDPTYPDVHAFLAVVLFRNGLVAEAERELDRLDALDPPAVIRQLTAGLRAQVEAALASTTTATVPP